MRRTDLPATGAMRSLDRETPRGDAGLDAGGFREEIPGDGGRPVWGGLARLEGLLPPPGLPHGPAGPLPGGGQRAPRAGRADGRAVGTAGGERAVVGSRFDAPIVPRGYAWWYVDALSDDQRHGITLIALLGNVFSHWYAQARAGGRAADPLAHCGLNVALYGPRAKRWCLTERGRESVAREPGWLALGPSEVAWRGDCLEFRIDEISSPLPSRVRGTVRVHPRAIALHEAPLDATRRHAWRPIAPSARVEVCLSHPDLAWSGEGYLDSNAGAEPLEDAFAGWSWSRAGLADGGTSVLYDVRRRDGTPLTLSPIW